MRINLSQLCDGIARSIGVDARDLRVKACFPLNGDFMEKYESNPKLFLREQYRQINKKDRILQIDVYYKNLLVLDMDVQGISPNDNDLHELLDYGVRIGCVGPGFYYRYPYFKLDGTQLKDENSKKNYKAFLKAAEFNTENIVDFNSYVRGLTKADIRGIKGLTKTDINRMEEDSYYMEQQ